MANILDSEPVRTKVYPLLVLIVGYLLVKGWVDSETSDFVLAALATLFGTVGVEKARASVKPWPSAE